MTDAYSQFFRSVAALAGEPQPEEPFNHIKQHVQRNSANISEVISNHALLECADPFLPQPLSDIDESVTFGDLLLEAAWEVYQASLQTKRALDYQDDDDDDPRDIKRRCKDEDVDYAVQEEGDGQDKRDGEDPFGNAQSDGQDKERHVEAQQEHSKPPQKAAEKKATRKKAPFDPRAFLEKLKMVPTKGTSTKGPSTKGPSTKGPSGKRKAGKGKASKGKAGKGKASKGKNGQKDKFRLHLATGLQIQQQDIAAVAQALGLDKVKKIDAHSRIVAAKAMYDLVVKSRMYKLRLLELPPSAAPKLVRYHKDIADFLKQDPQEALWWTNHEQCPVDARGIPDETWLMPTIIP